MKKLISLLLSLILAMSCVSCLAEEKTSTKDTLSVNLSADPERIGYWMGNANSALVAKNVYSSMMHFNREGALEYDAAASFERVDDTTYRVTLRDDVYFTDGHKLCAEDVVWTLNWAREMGDTMVTNTTLDFEKTHAVDDLTVEFSFTSKEAFLPLIFVDTFLLWQGAVEANEITPAGSGAYVVDEWMAGSYVKLTRNENYYGSKALIRDVYFKVVSEDSQLANALLSSELDLVRNLPVTDYEFINGMDEFTTYINPGYITQNLWFNCTDLSVLNNKDARKAICYAIDNASILNVVYGGLGKLTTAPFSSGCIDYKPSWGADGFYEYNPEKAKELFAQSGINWADVDLTIITDGSTAFNMMAQIIQQELQECGVKSHIVNYEVASYRSVCKDPTQGWDICILRATCGTGYGLDLLRAFLSSSMQHLSGWDTTVFDAKIAEAFEADDEKMSALLDEIVALLIEEMPTYPVVETGTPNAYVSNLCVDDHLQQCLEAFPFERMNTLYFD